MRIASSSVFPAVAGRIAGVARIGWWTRAMTLGVRTMVTDGERVLLVRHTYRPGWYLPGGAVDRGESAEAAAVRELREETGVRCTGRPALHGFYRNGRRSSRDHVACYVVRAFTVDEGWTPGLEIAEAAFFALDDLPAEATPATRARIDELRGRATPGEHW